MSTKKQILKVISWEEVKEMLPKENVHNELIDVLDTICTSLKKIKQDYFYLAEFEFGEYLISKGKIAFSNPSINYCDLSRNEINYNSDLSYSTDPLGLILEGNLEIYFENKSNQTHTYKVPISTLTEGSLFGTYGTLDNQFNLKFQTNVRDWFVVSGSGNNIWVATSFHTDADSDLLDELNTSFKKKKNKIVNEKWSLFLNKYVKEKAKSKVVYFPKHIIDELFKQTNNPLIKIAWEQTFDLRSNYLKENSVVNKIVNHNIKFFHQENFIIEFYEYLLKVINGEAECLLTINKQNHIIDLAFSLLNKSHSKDINYVPFEYGKIEKGCFGILLLPMLPLKNEYEEKGLSSLIQDILEISKIQDTDEKVIDYILGCSKKNMITPNKNWYKYIIEHKKFITDYLEPLNAKYANANFGSAEFSSFIIIKRK